MALIKNASLHFTLFICFFVLLKFPVIDGHIYQEDALQILLNRYFPNNEAYLIRKQPRNLCCNGFLLKTNPVSNPLIKFKSSELDL